MKNNTPLISVIIPTCNRAKLLSRAIKSVLNQTFQELELIIVDDGSTDNTREVVENFKNKDKRIKYIWQENSGGPSKTRNTGIRASRGEYIALLDDDDEWLPEKLEKQLLLFKDSEISNLGFVGGKENIISKKNTKTDHLPYKSGNILEDLCLQCIIRSPSAVLIKKSVLKKIVLFDEKIKSADDYDMWIRISQYYSFDYVKEPIYNYYVHENNMSRNAETFPARIKDEEYIFRKHEEIIKKYPKIYSQKIIAFYGWCLLSKKPKEARKYILKAIKDNPLRIKNYLFFIFSFFPKNILSRLMILKRRYINKVT